MKLDKSKPYGEVYGTCPYRYEQGGKYFNGAGNEVSKEGRAILELKKDEPKRGPNEQAKRV